MKPSEEMPRIIEDLKRDIRDYLFKKIKEDSVLEDFSILRIQEQMKEDEGKISTALEKLEEEKLISKHSVSMNVYLPKTKEGEEYLKRFAKKEFLGVSHYWLYMISLAALLLGIPYLNLQLPAEITSLSAAFLRGLQEAVFLSGAVGICGVAILTKIAKDIVKWKAVSPQAYERNIRILKYSFYMIFIWFAGYNILTYIWHLEPTLAVALTTAVSSIIGIALAISERRE